MSSVERHFNLTSSLISPHLAKFNGIHHADCTRAQFALILNERKDISRGLVRMQPLWTCRSLVTTKAIVLVTSSSKAIGLCQPNIM